MFMVGLIGPLTPITHITTKSDNPGNFGILKLSYLIAALFEAVEHFDIDKVSQLLSADNASINW